MKIAKRLVWLAVMLMIGVGLACGGGGKYGAAKDLINKQIKIMNDYADAMDKAGNAQDVAAALNAYAEASQDLIPDIKKVQELYPEMKQQAEPPAELKAEMDKMNAIMGRIMSASMKAAQYMQDPAVQEAQRKLGEAMSGMK